MRRGFRPPIIGQLFATIPAARSRCLSSFVAIARQGLPLPLRYEPSHVLALTGLVLLFGGFFSESFFRLSGKMILVGWVSLLLSLLAMLAQDRLVYGRGRARLIRQLDEVRRSVGLDNAILPESLEFLETTALQWERIEHALQTQAWREQEDLRMRVNIAAHLAMEEIVILECGSVSETGLADGEADVRLTETAANLALLADQVDYTSKAMMTYPREEYDTNGMSPEGVIPELEGLEATLARLPVLR